MRECLGEVSQLLAVRPELLGIEAEMVGVPEHLLEHEPRFLRVTRACQDEHMLNVPSSPMRPSDAPARTRYRNTRESSTRRSLIARSVESQRGSVELMNLTIGISSVEASSVLVPLCWTNACCSGSQKFA